MLANTYVVVKKNWFKDNLQSLNLELALGTYFRHEGWSKKLSQILQVTHIFWFIVIEKIVEPP